MPPQSLTPASAALFRLSLQKAFDTAEAINAESEELRERLATRHRAKRKEAAVERDRALQAVTSAASTFEE